jgi:hypothetical protein
MSELEHERELRARVAGRIDRLIVPLHEPMGVGVRAVLLRRGGGRQEEHLGLAGGRRRLRCAAPERGGLGLEEVAHDQPVELAERLTLEAGVLSADGGVLTHHEKAAHPAIAHAHEDR